MRISLRRLAVFDAVARHESVSRGAEEVGLSQSAASTALKELEQELGLMLFHRQGRKLLLNENGRRLRPMVRSLLLQAREIETFSRAGEIAGVIRMAATRTMADYVVAPLCTAFLSAHPKVQIKLEETSWQGVLDLVAGNSCDFGFVQAPCNRPELVFSPLLTDECTVFAAPGHPMVARQPLTLDDLASARWCLRGTGSTTRRMLTFAVAGTAPTLDIIFESNSNEALMHAVRSGVGLGCLSKRALASDLERGTLTPLQTPGIVLERYFGLVRPRLAYRSALQESFNAFALEQAAAWKLEDFAGA
jgi:DNA-binding transcriptional LysR family regulator